MVKSKVISGQKVEYADGVCEKHNIEQGDSLRITVHEVTSKSIGVRDQPEESFIVDLPFNANSFRLPDEFWDLHNISDGNYVLFSITEVIKSDGARPVRSPVSDGTTQTRSPTSILESDPGTVAEYEGVEPQQEILEQITADVLKSLGYEVEVNVYKENRGTGKSELDVWAEKPSVNFSVYASCKNWSKSIGRPTVDEEVGRVENLRALPQLRILVVKGFRGNGRESARANGFLPIEIGEKATKNNAGEIYELIHEQMSRVSLTLAPPKIESLAQRTGELSEELALLSNEIGNLKPQKEVQHDH